MPTYAYTGTLADIGLGALTALMPRMAVHPEVEAFGPDGLISDVPVPVTVDPVTGAFTMNLIPSGDLTPTTGGSPGVDYIIEVARFEQTIDGTYYAGTDVWKFTAVAGGGNIGGMKGGSLLAVWIGPPWPPAPLPAGLYIDTLPPNPWGVVTRA
ncbi:MULTISPECIES: hypothetical protein [unclassified Microbacterium]|uniref:hypothetical protein n=1 Tax=unclassified Microbacterium TaxID=2609290 RepID=UPI000EAA40E0|nr:MULTISPECIES: hypothetical protein [unclassified Microbacterium]MBT2485824.1 hypothetical protein [Microbacterium sp. ISL-108]RKN68587.1 hypothetical protein D7252_14000 [Microbacterium sp. CGR2]